MTKQIDINTIKDSLERSIQYATIVDYPDGRTVKFVFPDGYTLESEKFPKKNGPAGDIVASPLDAPVNEDAKKPGTPTDPSPKKRKSRKSKVNKEEGNK